MSRPSTHNRSNMRRQASRRTGFSLIEILVVIGLITFLTAAIVAVIPRVANASKVAATKATIKKVDEMLNDRINGFRRWIQKQDQQAGLGTPAYVLQAQSVTGTTILAPGTSLAAAKVIAIKVLFKMYFAQAYSELDPSIQSANPRGSSHKDSAESAECLYLILTKGPLFDTEPPSASDLKAIETADTDGDNLQEIVDAWGQPIRFYRWPTRLVRPSTSSPPTSPGPIDEIPLKPPSPLTLTMIGAAPRTSLFGWVANTNYPVGAKIVSGTTSSTGFSVVYQCTTQGISGSTAPPGFAGTQIVGTTISEGTSTPPLTWQVLLDPLSLDPDDPFGIATSLISETSSTAPALTPNTWSVPLIVSCGSDGLLGLFEPLDTSNFGNLAQPQADTSDPTGFNRSAMYDNITNHQQ
jgi:type II secretory pathway pseudopilin PulG